MFGTIITLLIIGLLISLLKKDKREPEPLFSENQLAYANSAKQIKTLINKWRVDNGLSIFLYDMELANIAYKRLQDLQGKPLRHDGWKNKLGTRGQYGEVLAREFGSNYRAILKSWINSSTHKRVLSLPHFKFIGVATDGDTVVAIVSN